MQTKNGEEVVEDLVWYYPDPLPEAQKIEGHLCSYDEKSSSRSTAKRTPQYLQNLGRAFFRQRYFCKDLDDALG